MYMYLAIAVGLAGSNPGSYWHRSMHTAPSHCFPANQCLEFEEHALFLSVCLSLLILV